MCVDCVSADGKRSCCTEEERRGVRVVEPVVMSEKPEFLGEEHGSLNVRLLELLIVDGQEGSRTTM
jgi:hypothetical protein